jgi:SpoIIAA-like
VARGRLHAAERHQHGPAVDVPGDVRFVIVFPEWNGMSAGAVWQDLKMGVEHLRAWKRIALVTDVEWMTQMTALFGWMTPGETRVFSVAEKADAISWAAD